MAEKPPSKDEAMAAILECAVCLEQVKSPYSLVCLHSYCKSCLMAVPQGEQDGNKGWFCPRCRSFSKQEEMRHNFFIDELIEVLSMKELKGLCQQCETEVNVSWRCFDCKLTLCNNCQLGHLKIPALKAHRIVPLGDEHETVVDKLVYCSLHPDKTIEFNCKVCQKPICITCKVTDHDEHKTETVDKALERLLPEIESNTKGIDDNIQILAAQVQAIESKIDSVKEAYTSCRIGMDRRLETMTNTIKAIRAKQEAFITEQESIALATLQKTKETLDNQISEANQVTNVVKTCTRKAKHASLLNQLQSHLFEKIKNQNYINLEPISIELPVATFDVKRENFDEGLSQMFGSPEVTTQKSKVSVDGIMRSDDRHLTVVKKAHTSDLIAAELTTQKNKVSVDGIIGSNDRHQTVAKKAHTSDLIAAEVTTQKSKVSVDGIIGSDNRHQTVAKKAHTSDLIAAEVTTQKSKVSVKGIIGSEDGHLCENLEDLFRNPGRKFKLKNFMRKDKLRNSVRKDQEVALLDGWHNRISYINDKIYAACSSKCKIQIFKKDGSCDKVIDTKGKRITVVKKAHNSDLIAAGQSGLFITDSEFSTWRRVAEGKFSDVIIHENRFSALRFDDPCVMTFSLQPTAGEAAQAAQAAHNTEWKISSTFHIDKNNKLDCDSTLGICGNHYYITSSLNKAIYTYSLNGTPVSTDTKSLGWEPHICGSDRRGKLLIGNWTHGTLHVLDSVSGEMTQVQDIGVKLDLIRDLVIDDEQSVWCLQGNEPWHLMKYTHS